MMKAFLTAFSEFEPPTQLWNLVAIISDWQCHLFLCSHLWETFRRSVPLMSCYQQRTFLQLPRSSRHRSWAFFSLSARQPKQAMLGYGMPDSIYVQNPMLVAFLLFPNWDFCEVIYFYHANLAWCCEGLNASCVVADAASNKIVHNLPFSPLPPTDKKSIAPDFHGLPTLSHPSFVLHVKIKFHFKNQFRQWKRSKTTSQ